MFIRKGEGRIVLLKFLKMRSVLMGKTVVNLCWFIFFLYTG